MKKFEMASIISLNAEDYIEYKSNQLNSMKMTLCIYRLGGVLTPEICLYSHKAPLPKLLIPFPQVWLTRLDR